MRDGMERFSVDFWRLPKGGVLEEIGHRWVVVGLLAALFRYFGVNPWVSGLHS